MLYVFYRTPCIGGGSFEDPRRSKLCNYIINDGTMDFWDWIHDARPIRYALAFANAEIHSRIVEDSEIKQLSPALSSPEEVQEWLSMRVEDITIFQILEDDGFPMRWVNPKTTHRTVFNYVSRCHGLMQDFRRARNEDGLKLFKHDLDTTTTMLEITTRQGINIHMTQKKLDTSRFKLHVKVRDVVHDLVSEQPYVAQTLGPIAF